MLLCIFSGNIIERRKKSFEACGTRTNTWKTQTVLGLSALFFRRIVDINSILLRLFLCGGYTVLPHLKPHIKSAIILLLVLTFSRCGFRPVDVDVSFGKEKPASNAEIALMKNISPDN